MLDVVMGFRGRLGVRNEGIENNKTLDHQGYTSFFLMLRNDSLQCPETTHQSSESAAAERWIEARTAAGLVVIYAIITGE